MAGHFPRLHVATFDAPHPGATTLRPARHLAISTTAVVIVSRARHSLCFLQTSSGQCASQTTPADGPEEVRMDYLLGASLSSFIAVCVAVLVLEPRVQSGERPAPHR